jgi:hypothetical protein
LILTTVPLLSVFLSWSTVTMDLLKSTFLETSMNLTVTIRF